MVLKARIGNRTKKKLKYDFNNISWLFCGTDSKFSEYVEVIKLDFWSQFFEIAKAIEIFIYLCTVRMGVRSFLLNTENEWACEKKTGVRWPNLNFIFRKSFFSISKMNFNVRTPIHLKGSKKLPGLKIAMRNQKIFEVNISLTL